VVTGKGKGQGNEAKRARGKSTDAPRRNMRERKPIDYAADSFAKPSNLADDLAAGLSHGKAQRLKALAEGRCASVAYGVAPSPFPVSSSLTVRVSKPYAQTHGCVRDGGHAMMIPCSRFRYLTLILTQPPLTLRSACLLAGS